jgi:serine/threonine-protein kinase HipA
MTYIHLDVVEVLAWGRTVGAVALDPRSGFYVFEYDPSWRRSGIELAPTTMPTATARHVFPALPPVTFHRLPALLADALPDDFGNALTTAYLVNEGVDRGSITPLDRLAYLGNRGTGALEFRPARGPRTRKPTAVALSELVTAARSAVTGGFGSGDGITEALSHLIAVGTSAGGARAKAVISWNPKTDEVRSGQLAADPGFQQWLVKLDGVGPDLDLGESADYGRIEYAYSNMARAAGITMTECRLLHEGGRAHFMTRRFDRRPDGTKVHMQTLCALAHLDFRQIGVHDYAELFDLIDRLDLGPAARAEAFRRMVFNVAAANCDDHTKNVSFLLETGGGRELSPAYDMTHAHSPTSTWTAQHLMAVNGRRVGITGDDLSVVADRFTVPGSRPTVAQVLDAIDSWSEFAQQAGVGATAADEVARDLAVWSRPLR